MKTHTLLLALGIAAAAVLFSTSNASAHSPSYVGNYGYGNNYCGGGYVNVQHRYTYNDYGRGYYGGYDRGYQRPPVITVPVRPQPRLGYTPNYGHGHQSHHYSNQHRW